MSFIVREFVKGGDKWSEKLLSLADSDLKNQYSILLHYQAINQEAKNIGNPLKNYSSKSASFFKMCDYTASVHIKRNLRRKIQEEMDELRLKEGLITEDVLIIQKPKTNEEEAAEDQKRAKETTKEKIDADLELLGCQFKRKDLQPKYAKVVLTRRI